MSQRLSVKDNWIEKQRGHQGRTFIVKKLNQGRGREVTLIGHLVQIALFFNSSQEPCKAQDIIVAIIIFKM